MSGAKQELYRQMHRSKPGYGAGPGGRDVAVLAQVIRERGLSNAASVVDWGCGTSKVAEKLWPEAKVILYDFAIEGIDDKPTGDHDVLICTDVMEHIPEEEVEGVLSEMRGLADTAIFVIHTGEAHNRLPNGENCHCTVRPENWWTARLLDHWTIGQGFEMPRAEVFGVVVRG